ncbi:MAG: HAD family hydrolase [Elusimicrobia bacterium]|nr:HAD family hydrolase [Elusimicrobiota bacterium]
MKDIQVIGFDADDTLWVNEPHYQAVGREFCELMTPWLPPDRSAEELYGTEMANMKLYGYGAKSVMLSLVETALRIGGDKVPAAVLRRLLESGRRLLDFPIELLPGVTEVLRALKGRYRLVLITKGDLLDQERKLERSGLKECFHRVQILSDKREEDYRDLLAALAVEPRNFLMVGNSMKSDILPVLALGGSGVYIPFSVTWRHEHVKDASPDPERFRQLSDISGLPGLLGR